jgi:hypothetical protein
MALVTKVKRLAGVAAGERARRTWCAFNLREGLRRVLVERLATLAGGEVAARARRAGLGDAVGAVRFGSAVGALCERGSGPQHGDCQDGFGHD